ncbi:unnamed protein product [Somion occarium]|uniref:Uncharacterized protein n=1 Tax=Somion occarium TaxID=3059160 RepID=A0ABP1D5B4_9APHY
MNSDPAHDNARALRLQKLFNSIIHGKTRLSPQNSNLFIEAISLQEDAVSCIDKVITSANGLASVQNAMRFDLTPKFLNGSATSLLQYLSAPDLSGIGGGVPLVKVVKAIVEPPIFWSAFHRAFQASELDERAQRCFAWLLLQLIQLPGEQADPYRDLIANTTISETLLSTTSHETRALAYEIKNIIATRSAGVIPTHFGPGGRHDNDFVDYHDIAILPTGDEILSEKPAFLRTSNAVDEIDADLRLATHLWVERTCCMRCGMTFTSLSERNQGSTEEYRSRACPSSVFTTSLGGRSVDGVLSSVALMICGS